MSGVGERGIRQEVTLPQMLCRAVDVWRAREVDDPSRAEAMRRLIKIGLDADRAWRRDLGSAEPAAREVRGGSSICPVRVLREAASLLESSTNPDQDQERVANCAAELRDVIRWFDGKNITKINPNQEDEDGA